MKNKWVWIGLAVLIILLLIWAYYNYIKKPENPSDTNSYSGGNKNTFPLKYGSTGKEVSNLQAYLNTANTAGIGVDGIWGPETEAAVKKYLGRTEISKELYDELMRTKIEFLNFLPDALNPFKREENLNARYLSSYTIGSQD